MTTQAPVRILEAVGQPLDDTLPPTTDVAVVEQSPLPISEGPTTHVGRWLVRHTPVVREFHARYGDGRSESLDLQRPGLGGAADRAGALVLRGINGVVVTGEQVNWGEVAVAALESPTVQARLAAAEPPLGIALLAALRFAAGHHEATKAGAPKRHARFAGAVAAVRTIASARRAA